MTAISHEHHLLWNAERFLERLVSGDKCNAEELRLQILEATASRLGGFSLSQYYRTFRIKRAASVSVLMRAARGLVEELERLPAPPALALCTLSREPLDHNEQRSTGAYHTDFRLAQYLASQAGRHLTADSIVIDPACGAGILLAAVTLEVCGSDRQLTREWLAKSVYAADLSAGQLRRAMIGLASLTDDVGALASMRKRWISGDSLLLPSSSWKKLAPLGFDLVIGNPPWERIKLTRHEHAKATGVARHYGADYEPFDAEQYEASRQTLANYRDTLLAKCPSLKGVDEPDLYMAFTDLSLSLVRRGGSIALLLPAGLIRSQGTEQLRKRLFSSTSKTEISLIENRAKFFAIDTRFKFLAVVSTLQGPKTRARRVITLCHAKGTERGMERGSEVTFSQRDIARVRPDYSIPEVRSEGEWRLFQRISTSGVKMESDGSKWNPTFMRERDMTRDKGTFSPKPKRNSLPLIEGRMIHLHRFGAKEYISGSGRRAVWKTLPIGDSRIAPQFWVDSKTLPEKVSNRTKQHRVGFCDITGQTNERAMMAAMIPPGVVCGNKVPTIRFDQDPTIDRMWLWIAIANSIPFDWMLRRVMTTTVNYFVLTGIPLPAIEPDDLPGRELARIASKLSLVDQNARDRVPDLWAVGELRARADALVTRAYGLSEHDVALMFEDFPLLDRTQPPLPGESRSTITKDLVLAKLRTVGGARKKPDDLLSRVEQARTLGAFPYVPAQTVNNGEEDLLASGTARKRRG